MGEHFSGKSSASHGRRQLVRLVQTVRAAFDARQRGGGPRGAVRDALLLRLPRSDIGHPVRVPYRLHPRLPPPRCPIPTYSPDIAPSRLRLARLARLASGAPR